MTKCWSEGELRAYLDRELPDGEMDAVRRHLAECAGCTQASSALAARAARISVMMEGLTVPMTSPAPLRMAPSRGHTAYWKWAGVSMALAAAAMVMFLLLPGRTRPAPLHRPPAPARQIAQPDAEIAAAVPARPGPPAPVRRPRPASHKPPQRSSDEFLALDDEPFETGVVMRVALGSGDSQADVIFDSDGRPRAFRPVR